MSRRLVSAWVVVAMLAAATTTRAQQVPLTRNSLPAQGYVLDGKPLTPLARVGLERAWYALAPLAASERLLLLSMTDNLIFAQTSESVLHVFDAETGRRFWSADLGPSTEQAYPAAANADTIFATGLNQLLALDRATGRTKWTIPLEAVPSSGVTADNERVMVGLNSGKLANYHLKNRYPSFFWQTSGPITSQPISAGQVVAFASHDGRVYVATKETPRLVYRFVTGGPISATMGTYGTRTLIVPSQDNDVYAIDLFTADTLWIGSTSAPVEQEPLVAGDDVYVMNKQGVLHAYDARNGDLHWNLPTVSGWLLAVGENRVYLETSDHDLFIVDRKSGKMLIDPRATRERAGLNLREFTLTPTNPLTGRLYMATPSGMILCLRELGRTKPYRLRDPNAKPFGWVPGPRESKEGAAPKPEAPKPEAEPEPAKDQAPAEDRPAP